MSVGEGGFESDSARRGVDDDFNDEQLDELNADYYRSAPPADYFEARLRLLALAAAHGVPGAATSIGSFQISEATREVMPTAKFVGVEAVNLLHHAAETMWRLFLAHEDEKCPWLALSRLRAPRQFPKALRKYLDQDSDERGSRIRQVLPIRVDGNTDERFEGIDQFLRVLARRLLDDGPVYNATKHGLSTFAETSRVQVGVDGDELMFARSGMWLTTIDRDRGEARDKWQVVSTAVDSPRTTAVASVCISMIRAIWTIGRVRFLDESPEGPLDLYVPSKSELRPFLFDDDGTIARVRRDLDYLDGGDRRFSLNVVYAPTETTTHEDSES
jgi:hypothetical protein